MILLIRYITLNIVINGVIPKENSLVVVTWFAELNVDSYGVVNAIVDEANMSLHIFFLPLLLRQYKNYSQNRAVTLNICYTLEGRCKPVLDTENVLGSYSKPVYL